MVALAQLNGGKVEQAKATLERLLRASPEDPSGNYLASFAALLDGDYQTAADLTTKLLQGTANEPGVYFVAGAAALLSRQSRAGA